MLLKDFTFLFFRGGLRRGLYTVRGHFLSPKKEQSFNPLSSEERQLLTLEGPLGGPTVLVGDEAVASSL